MYTVQEITSRKERKEFYYVDLEGNVNLHNDNYKLFLQKLRK